MPERAYVIDQLISAKSIAARIEALRTRIRVSFPSATPNKPVIAHMLSAMEARAP